MFLSCLRLSKIIIAFGSTGMRMGTLRLFREFSPWLAVVRGMFRVCSELMSSNFLFFFVKHFSRSRSLLKILSWNLIFSNKNWLILSKLSNRILKILVTIF